MATTTQSTRRKLSLLKLAEELGNVSKACNIMGYHRDTFYEVKRAFQTGGVAALVENRRGPRGPHPNRVSAEIEEKILDYCLERPTHGAQRVSNELRLQGVTVSSSGVRGVWLRHNLEPASSACCVWKRRPAKTPSCSANSRSSFSSVTAPSSAAGTWRPLVPASS